MIDRSELRSLINNLAGDGPEQGSDYIQALKDLGVVANTNVGRTDMQDGDDECVKWYAGQLLEILESKDYFAVNSIINCLDKFCPEVNSNVS